MLARSKRIVLNLTTQEKSLLVSLAAYEGRLSLNALVRHLIADAARERGINIPESTVDTSMEEVAHGSK